MEEEALHALAGLCSGDARIALNCLQTVYESKKAKYSQLRVKNEVTKEHIVICPSDIREILQKSSVLYDRNGEHCSLFIWPILDIVKRLNFTLLCYKFIHVPLRTI